MRLRRHNMKFSWMNQPKTFEKVISCFLALSIAAPYSLLAQEAQPSMAAMMEKMGMGTYYGHPAPGQLGGPDDRFAPNEQMKKAILQMPTVQGAIGAIGSLNQAMRVAAENPNDEWRREDVRKAMRAVPPAVQALAGSFASHQIGNSSLPFVLSMMGGFVDQNAPNSFDKFLKTPAPDAAPKGGVGEAPRDREYKELTTVVKEENKVAINVVQASTNSSPVTQTLVVAGSPSDLARILPVTPIVSTPVSSPSQESSRIVVKEEEAPKTETKEPVLNSLSRDIAVAESLVQQAAAFNQALEPKENEKEKTDDQFFSPEKKETKKVSKRKLDKTETKSLKPTSWLLMPIFYLGQGLENMAYARQTGQGMGGGGASNPGDQNGGGGGQILFGLAAIIAAVAPMVVAGIESEKEQNVATIQADAQIQQAEIQTSTQKEMAQLSSQTALAQAQTSREVAQMNNDAQTQRLQINLAATQQQRNEDRQMQQEQQAYQRQMEAQRIALAERQADESIRIAQEALEAKKLEAALSGGATNGSSQQIAAKNASLQSTAGSPLAAALANSATQSGTGTSATMGAGKSSPATVRGLMAYPQRQQQPEGVSRSNNTLAPSTRLLAAVDDVESNPMIRGFYQKRAGRRPIRRGTVLAAGQRQQMLRNAKGLFSGMAPLATGSFSEDRERLKRVVQYEAPAPVQPTVVLMPAVPVSSGASGGRSH